jgi:uncharacterized protein
MRTIIAGGSGFLGRALASALSASGHHVQILTRAPAPPAHVPSSIDRIFWMPNGSLGPWAEPCRNADVIINLAGASIGDGRWSPARKTELLNSRIQPTRSLVRLITESDRPPSVFISASATGFYGNRPGEAVTESSPGAHDFLATLAQSWEDAARLPDRHPTRLVLLRTGIVLDPREGALAKMLPPFRLGLGGPFGNGQQMMSWIHRDDWVSLVQWALTQRQVAGPLNAVSPSPVPATAFARTLGRVLGRPSRLPAPAFALRWLLGEMADPLLLFSQEVRPARALESGFPFAYVELEATLRHLLGERGAA